MQLALEGKMGQDDVCFSNCFCEYQWLDGYIDNQDSIFIYDLFNMALHFCCELKVCFICLFIFAYNYVSHNISMTKFLCQLFLHTIKQIMAIFTSKGVFREHSFRGCKVICDIYYIVAHLECIQQCSSYCNLALVIETLCTHQQAKYTWKYNAKCELVIMSILWCTFLCFLSSYILVCY